MLTTDRAAGAALSLLALAVLFECWRLGLPLGSLRHPGPAYLPIMLGLLLLALAGPLLALGRRSVGLAAAGWADWRHMVAILGTCAFAALALERLGYRLTIIAALLFLLGVVERRGLLATSVFAVSLALSTYFLFSTLLRVPLPQGPAGL